MLQSESRFEYVTLGAMCYDVVISSDQLSDLIIISFSATVYIGEIKITRNVGVMVALPNIGGAHY